MKTVEISGKKRTGTGKSDTKKIRYAGGVPCVLYGGADEPIHFEVDRVALTKLFETPDTFIITLDIEGEKVDSIIKESQFHPVTDLLMHTDFLKVSKETETELKLPVVLVGNSKGVRAGGKLLPMMRKISVKGIPYELPEKVEIDISDLELGATIKVRDASVEGLTITAPSSAAIAAVEIPRSLRGGGGGDEEGAEEEVAAE